MNSFVNMNPVSILTPKPTPSGKTTETACGLLPDPTKRPSTRPVTPTIARATGWSGANRHAAS